MGGGGGGGGGGAVQGLSPVGAFATGIKMESSDQASPIKILDPGRKSFDRLYVSDNPFLSFVHIAC